MRLDGRSEVGQVRSMVPTRQGSCLGECSGFYEMGARGGSITRRRWRWRELRLGSGMRREVDPKKGAAKAAARPVSPQAEPWRRILLPSSKTLTTVARNALE